MFTGGRSGPLSLRDPLELEKQCYVRPALKGKFAGQQKESADRWPKAFSSLVRPWGGSGLVIPRLQHDLGVWRSANKYYTIVATNLLRPFLG